jgi:hypothetical protein
MVKHLPGVLEDTSSWEKFKLWCESGFAHPSSTCPHSPAITGSKSYVLGPEHEQVGDDGSPYASEDDEMEDKEEAEESSRSVEADEQDVDEDFADSQQSTFFARRIDASSFLRVIYF